MKKIKDREKWNAFFQRRQTHEAEQKLRRKSYLRERGRARLGVSPRTAWELAEQARTKSVAAPADFSFINNIGGMLQFFFTMREAFRRGRNVFVDLQSIASLTPDAIIALLSKIDDYRFTSYMQVVGNVPHDAAVRSVFSQSGFYEHVRSYQKPESEGRVRIIKEASRVVESVTAKDLIRFATEKLYGGYRPSFGVQRTLVECMTNTHNHASLRTTSHEKWWASVYCEPDGSRARFTFIDNGIGIFKSALMDPVRATARILGFKSNADILKEILLGNVRSRTRLSYRGKGIPGIFKAFKRGQLRNLIIVTNDVYANVGEERFETLNIGFEGTFFYWEIVRD